MRHLILVGALAVGGVAVFAIADSLSSDALGMALGMFFGMCAGIPAALLVLAASRAQPPREPQARQPYPAPHPHPAMPVILVAGAGQPALNAQNTPPWWNLNDLQGQSLGQPFKSARQFRVVGDQDELVDEW